MNTLNQNSTQNAVDILKGDHAKVKDLFQKYVNAKADDEKERVSFQIQEALRIHSRLEEEVFYPAMKTSASDEEEAMVTQAFEDHRHVSLLIDELEVMKISDATYDEKMKALQRNVEQHVEKEEEEMFVDAEEKLGESLNRLGSEMMKLKEELEL